MTFKWQARACMRTIKDIEILITFDEKQNCVDVDRKVKFAVRSFVNHNYQMDCEGL